MKRVILGEYYFEVKKCPQIKFKAIKDYGQEKNDFVDNFYKYLFENWNSPEKKKFTLIENKNEDGLLEFKAYIEINTYEELLDGTQIILDFLNYAEKWNKDNNKVVYLWQQKEGQFVMPLSSSICLKEEDFIFSPYTGCFQTSDEIIENAKEIWKREKY